MKRITAEWLTRRQTQALLNALSAAGHQAFAVGGCVRNTLLGRSVSDIDVATSAHPDEVVSIAEARGFHAVPTGYDHGTITVVIEGVPYEVTTFRTDIETDGRRAIVRFTDDVEADARRRDFTMNALYCDAAGHVLDPVSGYDDLVARRIRFVDDPDTRIQEDYLRSLRFFRFHAQFGHPGEGPDPDALDAISRNLDGLESLSAERVGGEMIKLLAAVDPAPALAAMAATGALGRLIPGADARFVAPLVHLEDLMGLAPEPVRRLVSMGGRMVEDRLRLSRQMSRRYAKLLDGAGSLAGPGELAWRYGDEVARSALALRHALAGSPLPTGWSAEVSKGLAAKLPIAAGDLMPEFEGPQLGAALERATRAWIDSGFLWDKAALVAAARKQG